jgi:hypothetical protein
MTDPNEPVEIDVAELGAHERRLGGVVDRMRAAADAAGTPVSQDAFGAFGFVLAGQCAAAAAGGSEMLGAAHEAADEHRQKVGVWARDVDATEDEVAALFSTAPEMRDA